MWKAESAFRAPSKPADAVTSVAGGQWLRFLELESDAPD
jgi:hypothetical protein